MSINNKLIHRESFGPLSATMVPPMMIVVVQVLELLLAVEQVLSHLLSVLDKLDQLTKILL